MALPKRYSNIITKFFSHVTKKLGDCQACLLYLYRCYRSSVFLTVLSTPRYGRAPRGANEFHRYRIRIRLRSGLCKSLIWQIFLPQRTQSAQRSLGCSMHFSTESGKVQTYKNRLANKFAMRFLYAWTSASIRSLKMHLRFCSLCVLCALCGEKYPRSLCQL